MTYKLSTFVHAVEAGGEGRSAMVGPDTDFDDPTNAWALAAISNPYVWTGDVPPQADPKQPGRPATATTDNPSAQNEEIARLRAQVAELQAAKDAQPPAGGESTDTGLVATGDGQLVTKVPPQRGTGSGAPEWRSYARSLEVEVPEDASRDQVIAALEQAGKPVK